MKKSLLKDSIREIKNTYKRFLSIVLIVLLGVGFFAGIRATSPDMKDSVDTYFDKQNMMDIQVISTLGVTEDDVIALSQIDGVKQVIPTYSFDASIKTEEKDIVVKISAMPDEMNKLKLVEGSMPTNQEECVVEALFLSSTGYKIGDYITIEPEKMDSNFSFDEEEKEESLETVYTNKLKIVGTVQSPEYISSSRGTSKLGSGSVNYYMYIPKSNINMDVYTTAYITVDGALEFATYSDEYEDLINNIEDKIEKIAIQREQARYEEIKDEATKKLDEAQAEYDKEKQKAESEIADAESKLADARKQVENGEKELKLNRQKAQKEFENAQKQIEDGLKQLERSESDVQSNKEQANTQIAELEKQIELLKTQGLPAEELEKAIGTITSQISLIKQELKNAEETIQQSKEELLANKKELEKQKEDTNKQFLQAEQDLEKARKEIEENAVKLEDAKKEATENLNEAQEKLNDARIQISKIEKPTWYILDRNLNYGYAEYMQEAERIAKIAEVFPLIFFLVAALISLTSMSRMIEEQRVQIGTLKALGYNKKEISIKYIIYALLATIIGGLLGIVIGVKIIPEIIISMYGMMYTLPKAECIIRWDIGLAGIGFALICTVGATIYTCIKELKEKPASLMLPRAPKPGKRIFLERIKFIWSKMKFSKKVTARNIFRYKKKFLMTIIGVAGCTSLIIVGFGIRDAVTQMIPLQYEKIFKYDAVITLEENLTTEQISEEQQRIDDQEKVQNTLPCYMKTLEITSIENTQTLNLVVANLEDNISDFIELKSRTEEQNYNLEKDTVIITEKISTLLNIKVGDNITIKDTDDLEKEVTIGAITENYLNHYIYMSSNLYNSLYGENSYKPNSILIKETEDATIEDEESLGKNILQGSEHISGVSFLSVSKDMFASVMDNMKIVVYVLIVAAGLLAFAVLYNLSNVNISERIKELATLKVLGFYNKEVFDYITKETRILTAIGCIGGIFCGMFLTTFIMKTCELDIFMFNPEIKPMSFVYGIVITIIFAEIVNFAVSRTLKKINMADSLKSVD